MVASKSVANVLSLTYEHAQGGRPMAATDALVQTLDRWMVEGELERVRLALSQIDPSRCPSEVLTGVLSLTWHAKDRLEPTRGVFFESAMDEFARRGLPAERLAKVAERLR